MVKIGRAASLFKYAFLLLIVSLARVHGVDSTKFVMDIKSLLMPLAIKDLIWEV